MQQLIRKDIDPYIDIIVPMRMAGSGSCLEID